MFIHFNIKKLKELLKKHTIIVSSLAIGLTPNNAYEHGNKFDNVTNIDSIRELTDEDSSINLFMTDMISNDLLNLPSSIKKININYSYYIDSLDAIPIACPNIECIIINNCPLISSFDFLKQCRYLKCFYINNNAFVSQELVQYLNGRGIKHNISDDDVEVANKVESIYNRIINDDMSDYDKIRNITLYIMDNYEYDADYYHISNIKPIESMLEYKRGVCTGYTYLTSALLSKADIENYQIVNDDHIWNLVVNDKKYYYLDVANLDYNNLRFFVENTDNFMLFMSDPNVDFLSTLTAYYKDNVIIPKYIINAIEKSEHLKNFEERYCTGYISYMLKYLIPLAISSGLFYVVDKNKKLIKEKNKKL